LAVYLLILCAAEDFKTKNIINKSLEKKLYHGIKKS